MAKVEYISKRAFAKKIHVSEGAVRKAIESGKIIKGFNAQLNKINFAIAYEEYGQAKTTPKAGHGVSHEKVAEKLSKQKPNDEAHNDDELEDDLADMSYIELIQKVKINPTLSYQEGLRRSQILKLATEKIELEEKQTSLVRKAEVDKAMFAMGDQLKKDLQSIPSRAVALIRSAATEVEANNILAFEINQVLESFAGLGS